MVWKLYVINYDIRYYELPVFLAEIFNIPTFRDEPIIDKTFISDLKVILLKLYSLIGKNLHKISCTKKEKFRGNNVIKTF